jgi:Ca-activated chloride channel family protein
MVAFSSRAALITDVHTTEDELRTRLLSTSAKGMTAMLDGMYLALAKLRSAPTQRRVMLVITDGMDNRSRYNFKDVERALRESDVQVYVLGSDGAGHLHRLVESSGGRMFPFWGAKETSARIWAELRNQYVLSYKSSNRRADGKWRKIKIGLRTPKGMPPLKIYAKSGYYAPKR